ncbi:hypothetical protein BYT27DRAFT_7077074 [Phlegmacium glaucopus]|nr:hypothetical protein BYT27DRAFT_7077074 [Phlegmacium glaucopus]
MFLFTSFTPASRAYVACFSAVIILFGGLASLQNHWNLATMSDTPTLGRSRTTSSEKIAQDNAEFSWDLVPPERRLNWRKCFPGRQCARLIVPLNYSDPQGAEAIIALIRKPSALAESSLAYKGPILFNPGGPGGSGVELIHQFGDMFTSILGPQFDIVSFDPRGIGQSTPRVSFFRTAAERALWDASDLHNRESDVPNMWARSLVHGKLAEDSDYGYLRHINTDQTARDMLRIVEAHGRTKIQYWGFSYGSLLGSVFASMFPDNIERLVIDAVLDSENYFAALWSNNLLDTDKTMQSFYTGCADAGPDRCAFWAPSPDDIRQNLTNLYSSISTQPVPVKIGNTYGYVDHKMLHSAVFASLYSPFATFRLLAEGLAELAAGDGTRIFKQLTPSPFECSGDPSKGLEQNLFEAQVAVFCNDAANVPADLQSAQKHLEMMSKTSGFGSFIASIRVHCAGWPKFPKNHFQGKLLANTSHPILLVGNTADPVTPLWAAKKMSRGFNNSVVLTQNSPGHSSVAAPSLCTMKYIQQYFADGTLPKPGTVCQADLGPFDQGSLVELEQAQGTLDMDEEDRKLFSAIRELSSSPFTRFGPRFGN